MRFLILAMSILLAMPAAADTIKAGKWQITSVADAMVIPGMPPELAAKMQSKPTTITHCVTEAQIKDGPRALFEASKGNCRYTKFDMTKGKLESVAVCQQQGSSMTMHSRGTYTAVSYATKSTMTGDGKSAGMKMTANVSGKWLGACSK